MGICNKLLVLYWGKKRNHHHHHLSSFTFRASGGQNPCKKKTTTTTNIISSFNDPYCAVCLEEVRDGEKVRKLPKCNHCFHVGCIDAWFLARHSTCPLCRHQVFILPPPQNLQPPTLFSYSLSFLLFFFRKFGD
ncbi:hypothetical protein Tsubulata_023368 [Turnera subulata]|uniref:RING-type domain-containing protein n=1 Tax=Turnera subulata TaxID=218843 RepID=A0A9Q0J2D8_9ROSI|nr:hypothetical protein Tsubulata_023368 [Turnera subulata]